MKISEIKAQLEQARNALQDAQNRLEEAKKAKEEMVAKAQELVNERRKSLEKSESEIALTKARADGFKQSFDNATKKLERKIAEKTIIENNIISLHNQFINCKSKYDALYAEEQKLQTLQYLPSTTPEQRADFRVKIAEVSQKREQYHSQMDSLQSRIFSLQDKLPRVEQQINEYVNLVNELRPKVDDANSKLEEANALGKKNEELLHEANEKFNQDFERGLTLVREAETNKQRMEELVRYWMNALESAESLLNDYANKQYD